MLFIKKRHQPCQTVGCQDSEADTFGVKAENTDGRCNCPGHYGVQNLSFSGNEHIIRQHITAAQDQSAAQQIPQNIPGKQSGGTEHKGQNSYCGDIGQRRLDIDRAFIAQIDKSYQKQQLAGLSDGSRHLSNKHLPVTVRAFRPVFHGSQHSSGCYRIRLLHRYRRSVLHHRLRPGYHNQKPSHQSRIYKIVSDSAEHLLHHQNGKNRGSADYPQRGGHRQVESQKHTGHHRAEVPCRHRLFRQLLPQKFCQHTDSHGKCRHVEGADSKEINRSQKGRHQGDGHIQHQASGGSRRPQMRPRIFLYLSHQFPAFLSRILCFTVSLAARTVQVSSRRAGQV